MADHEMTAMTARPHILLTPEHEGVMNFRRHGRHSAEAFPFNKLKKQQIVFLKESENDIRQQATSVGQP
ncbi:hypothetical protein [Rhodoblastus sp.]|uniref:hypothetical protein n=1 Tax=Rhodoblastus sp. TaxID=1962975 RepID=UPI003F96F058